MIYIKPAPRGGDDTASMMPIIPDPELVRRFDVAGPRYTSYPTADRFAAGYRAADYAAWLRRRGEKPAPQPLSLYVHVPFCSKICYYCACNKIATRHAERGWEYLGYLEHELSLLDRQLTGSRRLAQLHLGGGTPTFLGVDGLEALMALVGNKMQWDPDGEYGIEIDPRTAAPGMMARLRGLGLNRASLGVQDFDPDVQRAINRVQPYDLVERVTGEARRAGFRSINFDLIYGLPRQTRAGFAATLERTVALRPDRIALYSYAHLPSRFKPQRRIAEADLPAPADKLQILLDAIAQLGEAGYVYVGMDHFALPGDELVRAQQAGQLHRNFQGYSTRADCDLVGLGVSAISKVGACYAQNAHDLDGYMAALARGELPVARGIELGFDDLLRRAVIMALMCDGAVDKAAVERDWQIGFDDYFAPDLAALAPHLEAGLVENDAAGLRVTPLGRLLVRAVAMAFDPALRKGAGGKYSRTV